MGRLLLVALGILVLSTVVCTAGIDESFTSSLDKNVWSEIGEPGSVNITSGLCTISRTADVVAGIRASESTAIKPDKSGVIRLEIDFAPDSSFTTKNNFFFGLSDNSGNNSVFVQTSDEFGWGWWGVTIKRDGVVRQSARFSILNGLPGHNWRFDVSPNRIRVNYGESGEYANSYFDSRRDKPTEAGWKIPTVPMSAIILDNRSTGRGKIALKRIKLGFVEIIPEKVYSLPGNGLGKDFVLASNHLPRVSIVVPDGCTPQIEQAARDIRQCIEASSNAVLPVVEESDFDRGACISVGPTKIAAIAGVHQPKGRGFRDERVIVHRIRDKIVIIGNDDPPFNGTQDAAIRFLNIVMGADYLYSTPTGKAIPLRSSVRVGSLNLDEKPALVHRTLYAYTTGDSSLFNKPLSEWYRWNHFGGTAIHHQHIFMQIAPPDVYFKDHPEYYSEIRGKRSITEPEGWQLCTTNPNVIKLAVDFCRQYLDAHPGNHTVSLSMNDGNGICQCAECRKLDSPDPVSGGARRAITFANIIAREIAKTHPGKGVSFYAYLSTLEPPIDMKCEPNVVVVLADSSSCVFHSYTDPSCGLARDARLRLDAWKKICREIVIYDYYGLYGDYMGVPFSNVSRSVQNARYAARAGIEGFTYDATYVPGPQGLHYWTAMRALWNPKLTSDNAIEIYCSKLYGKASKYMQKYYTYLDHCCVKSGMHSTWVTWTLPGPLGIWTDKNIEILQNNLAAAGKHVEKGSIEAVRIDEQIRLINLAKTFADLKHAQFKYLKTETEPDLNAYKKHRTRYIAAIDDLTKRGLVSFAKYVTDDYAPENPKPIRTVMTLHISERAPDKDPLATSEPEWNKPEQTVQWLVDERNYCPYPVTQAFLTYTDKALYVRVVCRDSMIQNIKPIGTMRDSDVWSGDCVRLSIVAGKDILSLMVNPKGTMTDEKNGVVSWNGKWISKVKISDRLGFRAWVVRYEIPWTTLGLQSAPTELKANIFRHVTTTKISPLQSWSPVFGDINNAERYALTKLEK